MPSDGQPAPVVGWHSGEEYLRRPTSVIGVGSRPVTVGTLPIGTGDRVTPAGITCQPRSVGGIFTERTAGRDLHRRCKRRDVLQVVAGGRISRIDFIAGQQAMSLRSDVADLKQNVPRQLPLDGQIVLIGILQAQIGRKLAEESHWPELRPIDGLPARRIQDAVERIWETCRRSGPRRESARAGSK